MVGMGRNWELFKKGMVTLLQEEVKDSVDPTKGQKSLHDFGKLDIDMHGEVAVSQLYGPGAQANYTPSIKSFNALNKVVPALAQGQPGIPQFALCIPHSTTFELDPATNLGLFETTAVIPEYSPGLSKNAFFDVWAITPERRLMGLTQGV